MTPAPGLTRLIVLRHGKAERQAPSGLDVDRPLRPRGVRQATFIGETLLDRGWTPSIIVTSPLVRAMQTAEALQASLKSGSKRARVPIEIDDRLSTRWSQHEHLLAASSRLGSDAHTIVLVGHNPTLSTLVVNLLRNGEHLPDELSTGQAAVLHWPDGLDVARFSAIPKHSAHLEALLRLEELDDD